MPSSAARGGRGSSAQKFFGKPELAPRDDVLLDLGGAAADRVDHRVAVASSRRGRGAAPRPCARAAARRRPATSSVALATRCESCGREQLVLRGLDGRRLAADARRRARRSAGRARARPRTAVASCAIRWRTSGSLAQRLAVARLACARTRPARSSAARSARSVNIVKRSRSSASEMYWKPLPRWPTQVVVGHEHVVEEHLVGASRRRSSAWPGPRGPGGSSGSGTG